MRTIRYHTMDKKGWGKGPWESEPDKVQFQDKVTKLPCLIVRNQLHGALCGYVGVSEGHPLYKKDYSEGEDLEVHGGLTFADFCQDRPENTGICHVPGPDGDEKVWWLGFDCAHFMDISPAMEARMAAFPEMKSFRLGYEKYRTVDYVRREVKKLAKQLREMEMAS